MERVTSDEFPKQDWRVCITDYKINGKYEEKIALVDTYVISIKLDPQWPLASLEETDQMIKENAKKHTLFQSPLLIPLIDSMRRFTDGDLAGGIIELSTVSILFMLTETHGLNQEEKINLLKTKTREYIEKNYRELWTSVHGNKKNPDSEETAVALEPTA